MALDLGIRNRRSSLSQPRRLELARRGRWTLHSLVVPHRRRGVEYLDDPGVPRLVTVRAYLDLARTNTLFGGAHVLRREVARVIGGASGRSLTLLDVGTALGDLPASIRALAATRGAAVSTIGVEYNPVAAYLANSAELPVVRATVLALPFADASVDIVTCSQLLHHFDFTAARAVVRELHRVARHSVIISDLRRSWSAAGLFWFASHALGLHPVTRHDGLVSVLRGFYDDELITLVRESVSVRPERRDYPLFRTVVAWHPSETLGIAFEE